MSDNYRKKLEKQEKEQENKELEKRNRHKCFGCIWGKWTGIKFFCLWPECKK